MCVISIVAIDALVLKHHAISIHSADYLCAEPDSQHLLRTTQETKVMFQNNITGDNPVVYW